MSGNRKMSVYQNAANVKVQLLNNIMDGGIWGCIYLPITGLAHDIRNNIAIDGNGNGNDCSDVGTGAGQIINHNSWNGGGTVTSADFLSLDSSQLTNPRQADGSLPDLDFLKLVPGSDLIRRTSLQRECS